MRVKKVRVAIEEDGLLVVIEPEGRAWHAYDVVVQADGSADVVQFGDQNATHRQFNPAGKRRAAWEEARARTFAPLPVATSQPREEESPLVATLLQQIFGRTEAPVGERKPLPVAPTRLGPLIRASKEQQRSARRFAFVRPPGRPASLNAFLEEVRSQLEASRPIDKPVNTL